MMTIASKPSMIGPRLPLQPCLGPSPGGLLLCFSSIQIIPTSGPSHLLFFLGHSVPRSSHDWFLVVTQASAQLPPFQLVLRACQEKEQE